MEKQNVRNDEHYWKSRKRAIAENRLAQGEQIRAIVQNPEKAAHWKDSWSRNCCRVGRQALCVGSARRVLHPPLPQGFVSDGLRLVD
jgi:hypothetical protein